MFSDFDETMTNGLCLLLFVKLQIKKKKMKPPPLLKQQEKVGMELEESGTKQAKSLKRTKELV